MILACQKRIALTLTPFQYLPTSPGDPNGQYFLSGEITLVDNGTAYKGYGTYGGGFNNGQ